MIHRTVGWRPLCFIFIGYPLGLHVGYIVTLAHSCMVWSDFTDLLIYGYPSSPRVTDLVSKKRILR
jgi:hypothetical protein